MRNTEHAAIETALALLRNAGAALNQTDAGICRVHLDACISALEVRMAKLNLTPVEFRDAASEQVARTLGRPLPRAADY